MCSPEMARRTTGSPKRRSFFLAVWCKAQMNEVVVAFLLACVWVFTDYPRQVVLAVTELPEVINLQRWRHNGEQPTQETRIGGQVVQWPAVDDLYGHWIH